MWKPININNQSYYFQCCSSQENFHFHLYNLKEVWSEQCSIEDIVRRAKQLNKRISYDSETVINTITIGTPTTITLDSFESIHTISLKFHVVGRPFNFEWKLKPLPPVDFQKLVTYPLFMSIYYLSEQIKELKGTIKKKDEEIKQYIDEGAILKRKTVATEVFDENTFNNRFAQVNEISKSFQSIADEIKTNFSVISSSKITTESKEKPNESTFISNEKIKKSPNKKRKFFESRRIQMEKLHKAKNSTLEYESSQSQPTDELAEIYKSLDELNAKRLAPP